MDGRDHERIIDNDCAAHQARVPGIYPEGVGSNPITVAKSGYI